MGKKIGITTQRPGRVANIPANADAFIEGKAPEATRTPAPRPVAAAQPAQATHEPPPPAAAQGELFQEEEVPRRRGPQNGKSTVLKNGNQRILISLDPATYEATRARAFRDRVAISELVRRALRDYLDDQALADAARSAMES